MMRSLSTAFIAAFAAVVGFAPSAGAQGGDIALPPSSMEWRYECHAGEQCPTTCSIGGAQIFTTANYVSLTILQLPNQVFWFRVDTGDKMVEYVLTGERINCAMAGATLKAARAWPAGAPEPRKPQ
jgi:hypothetical protein